MSRKVVWITGAQGSLGTQICNLIDREKYEVLTSDTDVDVTDREAVNRFAQEYRPDVLINCAGFLKENGTREDITRMYKVNALGARNQASASAQVGAKMIQMSIQSTITSKKQRQEKANSSYYLLKKTSVPIVIVECGFLSNPEEAQKLCDPDYFAQIAFSIYQGLNHYLQEN